MTRMQLYNVIFEAPTHTYPKVNFINCDENNEQRVDPASSNLKMRMEVTKDKPFFGFSTQDKPFLMKPHSSSSFSLNGQARHAIYLNIKCFVISR